MGQGGDIPKFKKGFVSCSLATAFRKGSLLSLHMHQKKDAKGISRTLPHKYL
tara:strand:+ start:467 stop:622 length:156 start_codon:yes stop_codon:yes gene_type:complete